jgi:acetyltransferase
MSVYKISRYPRELALRDGTLVTLRPMQAGDAPAVLEFFKRVPEEERYLLKEDVTSPVVVEAWERHLDYDRALPLLALVSDRVVADAVLIRHRGGSRAHAAELRIVVDPDCRGCGLGVALVSDLLEIAYDAELEEVTFELVKDVEDDAIKAVEFSGAMPAGTVCDAVKDLHGRRHDLVYMTLPLGRWWRWSQF